MRIVFTPATVTAIAAALTAALALPAAATSAGAIGARNCTKPESVAHLSGYDAFVNSAAAQDTPEGYHRVTGGQSLTMAIQGTLTEQVTGGKARFAMMQAGQKAPPAMHEIDLAGVFADRHGKKIAFPVAPGAFTWYMTSNIPAELAPGHYLLAVDSSDEAGRGILCFSTAFKVD